MSEHERPILTRPGADRLSSFVGLVEEFEEAGETYFAAVVALVRRRPASYLRRLTSGGGRSVDHFWYVKGSLVLGGGSLRSNGGWWGNLGFYVRPTARGRGHGRDIMRGLVEHARRSGRRDAVATVALDNLASRGAIESAGGVRAGQLTFAGHTCLKYAFPMDRSSRDVFGGSVHEQPDMVVPDDSDESTGSGR